MLVRLFVRLLLSGLAGVAAAALLLGFGLAYGWIIDHMPWNSKLPPPPTPTLTGGDFVRGLGVYLSAAAALFVPFYVYTSWEDRDA